MESNMNRQLLAIQTKLKVPKNQYNNFGHYRYRTAADIYQAAKPFLEENKALLTLSDSPELKGDWHYIKSIARFSSEDGIIEVEGWAREDSDKKGMDKSQITGSTSSYARKYALNGLFLLDDSEDPDSNEHQQQTKKAPVTRKTSAKPQVTDKQLLAYQVMFDGGQVSLALIIKQALAGDAKSKGYLKLLPKNGQAHEAYEQIYSRKLYEKA